MSQTSTDQNRAHGEWRTVRWEEIAGPDGKATVVARGRVIGPDDQAVPGAPGRWSADPAGALTVTATAADGITIDGEIVDGTVEVPSNTPFGLPGGLVGLAGGADGAYGVLVRDPDAVTKAGLVGVDAFPYDPAWVVDGQYRAVEDHRRVRVERLTSPRHEEDISAPADLVVTLDGVEHVLTVIADYPGQRVVIFTDETSGDETPDIGRWLVLPLLEPGTPFTVDFNQAVLSPYHLNHEVYTCPLPPPGNHLPTPVTAGERALVYSTHTATTRGHQMSQDLQDTAIAYLRNLEKGDWDAARALCTADATVWHNDGKGDSTLEENITSMKAQSVSIEFMRYTVIRQFSRPGEVLQQHEVDVVAPGMRGTVHAAAYFRFENGLISRIEEYAGFVPGPQ